jgi:transposase
LAEELGVQEADENDLYAALDWLAARQRRIEKKLAARHLHEGCCAFYDVTSSYYEGRTCSLARMGNNRDKKNGRPIIVYGALCEQQGRPVSVDVYPGNTGDPSTVLDQVLRLREVFGLQKVVLVGDRGMITQLQIEQLERYPGLGWITALRSSSIRKLLEKGQLHSSLFDDRNLAEIGAPEYPNERLVACYNPFLAEERKRKRRELIEATEVLLGKIKREVERRSKKPLEKKEIALKVGRVLNKFKVGKHFLLTIEDNRFEWSRREEKIEQEEQLDGIYIVRTSEAAGALSAEDAVRQYKNLSRVEQVFRAVKGLDTLIRPIRHRDANRVRAHIFLCMLAYYVEWHMRRALAPLLFEDEELDVLRYTRDPVAKAETSESAKRKKSRLTTEDGFPVHSFSTLLAELGTRHRVHYRLIEGGPETTFTQLTVPTAFHRIAFGLLGLKCTQ